MLLRRVRWRQRRRRRSCEARILVLARSPFLTFLWEPSSYLLAASVSRFLPRSWQHYVCK